MYNNNDQDYQLPEIENNKQKISLLFELIKGKHQASTVSKPIQLCF